jgi:hypothetical protein
MFLNSLISALRGRWVIDAPPENVEWRPVRAKGDQPIVRARRAEADCTVETRGGSLQAKGGEDFIVQSENGDTAIVRGDIFERTYEPLADGRFRKRSDVIFHAFTLDRPALVHTLEGPQKADTGDWVMEGVSGELWPVSRAEADAKYQPA